MKIVSSQFKPPYFVSKKIAFIDLAKLLALALPVSDPARKRVLLAKRESDTRGGFHVNLSVTSRPCQPYSTRSFRRTTVVCGVKRRHKTLISQLLVIITPMMVGALPLNAGQEATVRERVVHQAVSTSTTPEFTRDFQEAVERLRGKLEEWGVLTASVPVVMSAQEQFKIDKNATDFPTAKEYINSQQANVSGTSFQSTETAFTNQAAVSAKGEFQLNSATGQVEPILPPASDQDLTKISPPPLNITNVVSAPAAPGALAGQLAKTTGIPGRTAVLLGVNDKLTERILATMASPPFETFLNKDYGVYFAIVQISCNPGLRTRENYIADLTAECEYFNTKLNRAMPEVRHEFPKVFSVLPLLDAQNLELGSSDRQLRALAAQISASYPTVGLSLLGQDLLTFVHKYQKDNITRSPITVTNSYSTGRTFGFRLSPSFTAQADPSYRKSRAANILNPTAFPVLVTVVTKPSLFGLPDVDGKYDSVRVNVATRWLIKDRPPLPVWYKRLYTPLRRNTISMRADWARDVSTLTGFVDRMDAVGDSGSDPVLTTLREDAVELIDKCGPQRTVVQVTPEAANTLSIKARELVDVAPVKDGDKPTKKLGPPTWSPEAVPKSDAFAMVIQGDKLERATKILIGGKPATSILPLNLTSVLAVFPPGPILHDGKQTQLVVVGDVGTPCVETVDLVKADQVKEKSDAEKKADEEKAAKTASIALDRDANGNLIAVKVDRSKLQNLADDEIAEMMTRVSEANARPQPRQAAPSPTPTPTPPK